VVAARESDMATLIEAYRDMDYIDLTIDGLQPEKGHETLYTVRELVLKRVWFATPLLSSAASEVHRLIERAKDKVRGLRDIERKMLAAKQEETVAAGEDAPEQVVLDYCAAVRGVLNDDQGGPLSPPGVRMAKGLGEIRDSIDRGTAAGGRKKGGAKRRCAPSEGA
jgi:hypothetical protein